MASVSSLNPLISKSLSVTQHFQFGSHQEPKISIRMTPKKLTPVPGFSIESFKARRVLPIQAFTWSSEPEKESEPIIEAVATAVAETVVEEEPIKETSHNTASKEALIDALYGTERGLKASSETRAEIVEIISQLEANNPTPAPTEALPLLDGKWILVYTSYKALFPLLASGTFPLLLKVEEISQIIDSENFSVENMVVFAGQLATTSVSSNAKFEVRSPKRVQNLPNPYQSVFDSESFTLASIGLTGGLSDCFASSYQVKFEQGVIGTPQLIDSIVLPDSVQCLGRDINLIPFKGLITSIQDTASSVIKGISSNPSFEFPITSDKAQTWLLTTYLDGELRISRGDGGSLFILIKEGSLLLNPKPKDQAPESVTIES